MKHIKKDFVFLILFVTVYLGKTFRLFILSRVCRVAWDQGKNIVEMTQNAADNLAYDKTIYLSKNFPFVAPYLRSSRYANLFRNYLTANCSVAAIWS